jgi:hypothetical protein
MTCVILGGQGCRPADEAVQFAAMRAARRESRPPRIAKSHLDANDRRVGIEAAGKIAQEARSVWPGGPSRESCAVPVAGRRSACGHGSHLGLVFPGELVPPYALYHPSSQSSQNHAKCYLFTCSLPHACAQMQLGRNCARCIQYLYPGALCVLNPSFGFGAHLTDHNSLRTCRVGWGRRCARTCRRIADMTLRDWESRRQVFRNSLFTAKGFAAGRVLAAKVNF